MRLDSGHGLFDSGRFIDSRKLVQDDVLEADGAALNSIMVIPSRATRFRAAHSWLFVAAGPPPKFRDFALMFPNAIKGAAIRQALSESVQKLWDEYA